jgi:hypothetical protein
VSNSFSKESPKVLILRCEVKSEKKRDYNKVNPYTKWRVFSEDLLSSIKYKMA